MSDLSALLTDEALAAADWADQVRAALPSTLVPEGEQVDDEDFDEDALREQLEQVCEGVLADPRAIAQPAWGEVVRAVVRLSCDYRELTDDAYGEALDPNDAADDEGGVVEMIEDLGLSTIGDALTLLAVPSAVARSDWAELVRHVLDEKARRFGTGAFLSYGMDEADALFEAEHVRAHPAARELWQHADTILPLHSESP